MVKKINFVFDLDGTLIDSSAGIYSAYVDAIEKANLDIKTINYINFKKNIGPPFEIMSKNIHPNLNNDEFQLLNNYFREIYDSHGFLNYKVYENVSECISYLNQLGHSLFILSNKRNIPTQIIIRKEFPNIFKNVWGKKDNKFNKSDMLMHINLLSGRDTVYIGDTENDKKAADQAGIKFIYASYGFGVIPKTKSLLTCKKPSELKSLLIKKYLKYQ